MGAKPKSEERADRLGTYRAKRDPAKTPEPMGRTEVPPRRRRAPVRHPGASCPQPPLGPAPRARRRHGLVGAAQGTPRRPGAEPPGRAHRGPPDGLQLVPGRHPSRGVRGGLRDDLGPGPLRRREVVGLRGQVRPARRPGLGRLRLVPDQGPRLDDPPPRAGDPHRSRADVHRADAGRPGSACRKAAPNGPTRSSGTAPGPSPSPRAAGSACAAATARTSRRRFPTWPTWPSTSACRP